MAEEHLQFFERFQPYKDRKPFDLLRELSNAYRHRELIKVQKAFQRTDLPTPTPRSYRIPAGHVVEEDHFSIAVSLGDGASIVETLEEIQRRVRQAAVEFRQPLQAYILDNCIEF